MKIDKEWKIFRIKDFSGGWASRPQKESESETFENLEVTREKYARVCFGDDKLHSTTISDRNIVGVGFGSAGSHETATLIMAHSDSLTDQIWLGTNNQFPMGLTNITGATVVNGSYWQFQQFSEPDGTPTMLLCNSTDGLYAYEGGGSISQVTLGFSAPIVVAAYQGHLFALVAPNQLRYSDFLDYTSWPGANLIEFSTEKGKVSGLASLPGKLLIFFQEGIGRIDAEKAKDFGGSFQMISSAGTVFPLTISANGSEIGLLTTTGPVLTDATGTITEFIGEPLKEFWAETLSDASNIYGWRGVLTPFYYALINANLVDENIYLYDRKNKCWSKIVPTWNPMSVSFLEYIYREPPLSGTFAIPTTGMVFGASDSSAHFLLCSGLSGTDVDEGNPTWNTTSPSAVESVWRSRFLDFGTPNILKQIRRVLMSLEGSSITTRVYYTMIDGSVVAGTLQSPAALATAPFDTHKNFALNLADQPKLCRGCSIEIRGRHLEIRQVSVVYREKRLA